LDRLATVNRACVSQRALEPSQFVWEPGKYIVQPTNGATFTPGYWQQYSGGWAWVDGRWNWGPEKRRVGWGTTEPSRQVPPADLGVPVLGQLAPAQLPVGDTARSRATNDAIGAIPTGDPVDC
jgi:hypothetical protein